ncbi:hypothetical protein [Massilia aerilata]|uniref:Uncharacterized protein n=1 Tax=Massilia aerilata TaxID=453817 RepID=A0ABW0RQ20_9BURK
MRLQYSPAQLRMLIQRAENQFERTITQSLAADPGGRHVARAAHAAVHETVVSLIKLFRDQIPGAAAVATQLARIYAKGADANAGVPTLDCLRRVAELTREAREHYLPATAPADPAAEPEPERR